MAKALQYQPRCTQSFLEGSLSWTALWQISKVAATDTEEAWLEFADKNSPERVQAEVEDSLKKNRNLPRSDGYGLPNLETNLKIPLTLAELAIVQKGN